jgi:SM-20-related protein
MADNLAPFHTLDESAITAAELRHDPYDYVFAEQVISLDKDAVLADAPVIPHRGSYALASLRYGPAFTDLTEDLLSERFRHLMERKFDIDLTNSSPAILMTGDTSGRSDEGYAHADSKHKILTVILGLSREWPFEHGRLRVLRSPNRDDYAFELAPVFGNLLIFRVSEDSWHGFLPQKAPRMSLELYYCDTEAYVKREYFRHRVTAIAKAIPPLRAVLDILPRHASGAGFPKRDRNQS